MAKKENARVKQKLTDLRERTDKIEAEEMAKLKRRNRIDVLFHVVLILLTFLPVALVGSLESLLTALAFSMWIGLSLFKDFIINRKNFVIGMMSGIHITQLEILKEMTDEGK